MLGIAVCFRVDLIHSLHEPERSLELKTASVDGMPDLTDFLRRPKQSIMYRGASRLLSMRHTRNVVNRLCGHHTNLPGLRGPPVTLWMKLDFNSRLITRSGLTKPAISVMARVVGRGSSLGVEVMKTDE